MLLFTDDMTIYVEKPKKVIEKLLDLVRFNEVTEKKSTFKTHLYLYLPGTKR